MNNQNFFTFIKWYFNMTTKKRFPEKSMRFSVSQKERLPEVIFAYLLFIASWGLLFWSSPLNIFYLICANFIVLLCLILTRFGFIYYAILYKRSKHINRSLNDKIILEEHLLLKLSKEVRYMLTKYYKVFDSKGNIFYIKYYLANRKKGHKDIVLKITSNKVCLNKTVISNQRLNHIDELEELIKNNMEKFL